MGWAASRRLCPREQGFWWLSPGSSQHMCTSEMGGPRAPASRRTRSTETPPPLVGAGQGLLCASVSTIKKNTVLKPSTLLEGMEIGAATTENTVEAP